VQGWYQTEQHRPFVRMPPWEKITPGVELLRGEMDVLDVIDRLRDEIADMIVMQRIDNSVAVAPTRHYGETCECVQQPR